jgi:hypothetical protein
MGDSDTDRPGEVHGRERHCAGTIKMGSARTPGSVLPHVELRDATGQRVDPWGNPVLRRSAANHTPIDWDLSD